MTQKDLITITVKFFADLTKYGPSKEEIHLSENTSINLLLDKYQIPKEKIKLIILVNGIPHHNRDYVFKNGDIIALFPPLAGG
jgi:molybdopterin converting factor small subunit